MVPVSLTGLAGSFVEMIYGLLGLDVIGFPHFCWGSTVFLAKGYLSTEISYESIVMVHSYCILSIYGVPVPVFRTFLCLVSITFLTCTCYLLNHEQGDLACWCPLYLTKLFFFFHLFAIFQLARLATTVLWPPMALVPSVRNTVTLSGKALPLVPATRNTSALKQTQHPCPALVSTSTFNIAIHVVICLLQAMTIQEIFLAGSCKPN